jgi:hypothetical protein
MGSIVFQHPGGGGLSSFAARTDIDLAPPAERLKGLRDVVDVRWQVSGLRERRPAKAAFV